MFPMVLYSVLTDIVLSFYKNGMEEKYIITWMQELQITKLDAPLPFYTGLTRSVVQLHIEVYIDSIKGDHCEQVCTIYCICHVVELLVIIFIMTKTTNLQKLFFNIPRIIRTFLLLNKSNSNSSNYHHYTKKFRKEFQ